MKRGLPEKKNIKDVNKVIAVSSAKGGVGKSTIASKSRPSVYLVQLCRSAAVFGCIVCVHGQE